MKILKRKFNMGFADFATGVFFRFFALNFNLRPSLRHYLKSEDGWINFTFAVKTENLSVQKGLRFNNGCVSLLKRVPEKPDAQLIFLDEKALGNAALSPPNELMISLMKNQLVTMGNLAYLQLFNFYLSLLLKRMQISKLKKNNRIHQTEKIDDNRQAERHEEDKRGKKVQKFTTPDFENINIKDSSVIYLNNPYLSELSLADFPRLQEFLRIHYSVRPKLCHERSEIITDWYRRNGFEIDTKGKVWIPELRQAKAFKYLMENKKSLIRENDLIAGTTTPHETGVVVYPDGHGTMIWGELLTAPYRGLNPYDVDEETIEVLHKKVFPFWVERNFREWVRKCKNYPVCQKVDERFAAYFLWKSVALSHTILDYPKILSKGTIGLISDLEYEIKQSEGDNESRVNTLKAMKISLEGINAYAENLSRQAEIDAERTTDAKRRKELTKLSAICNWVPRYACTTLHEAVNSVWIIWIGAHMENTNAGLSLGRLDQWLQPYFESDMRKLEGEKEKSEYIKFAIELIGCLYMRCTDHLPLVPDIANYLFGGSSSDQAITLGGITPHGEDGVNDMTYIFLKVTEILGIRDPNVNARYHKEINSDLYLKRLCEVNLNTGATPSIHNDEEVMISLKSFGFGDKDIMDWSATGCVEPTISGKHMGHTNSMMFNMVAALEMAMNNGKHPLMRWELGPDTGDVESFSDFESFFLAFEHQLEFLVKESCKYNNYLGLAHQCIRPTPYISALMEGPLDKGMDVTKGGALYNTSGTACIGLADIVDSLMVIKKLVFEEKRIDFKRLINALSTDYTEEPKLLSMAKNRVKPFGSGDKEALEIANRVIKTVHRLFRNQKNYRGGAYNAGFWSMSNHVAFGTLTGALPSGRLSGKAFTPGLTPQAGSSQNILDNIRDVASLDSIYMGNNLAFNLKVVPSNADSHEKCIDNIFSYVKGYCQMGGMQIQLNVISSEVLKDAMENPENYKDLLVRISGYNAYFVTLNRDMQIELIERAEFGL